MDPIEARADRARALLSHASALLLLGGDAREGDLHIRACLRTSDAALKLAPHLAPVALERGIALYYGGEYGQAIEQFTCCASLDDSDLEPYLWRFLCLARLEGQQAAEASLRGFRGWDSRLGMMLVLELFRDQATAEEVLECAAGDCHSLARASFASALYFEATAQENLAVTLLRGVAELRDCGDSTANLRDLARCHLRVLERRLEEQPEHGGVEEEEAHQQEEEDKSVSSSCSSNSSCCSHSSIGSGRCCYAVASTVLGSPVFFAPKKLASYVGCYISPPASPPLPSRSWKQPSGMAPPAVGVGGAGH